MRGFHPCAVVVPFPLKWRLPTLAIPPPNEPEQSCSAMDHGRGGQHRRMATVQQPWHASGRLQPRDIAGKGRQQWLDYAAGPTHSDRWGDHVLTLATRSALRHEANAKRCA